jgi:hypothetical protein
MDCVAHEQDIPAMIAEAQRLTRLSIAIAARKAQERIERQAAQRRQRTIRDAAHELLYGRRRSE